MKVNFNLYSIDHYHSTRCVLKTHKISWILHLKVLSIDFQSKFRGSSQYSIMRSTFLKHFEKTTQNFVNNETTF